MSFGQILIDYWVKSSTNENGHRVIFQGLLSPYVLAPLRPARVGCRSPYALHPGFTGPAYSHPAYDHLWSKLVFAARKFLSTFLTISEIRNNLPPWDANVRLYVVAVKTLSQYIVLINQVPHQGLPKPQLIY